MRWKKDYADLIAPYYDRLQRLVSGDETASSEDAKEFVAAAKGERPAVRPLQMAWVALHSLPEVTRQKIILSFSKTDRRTSIRRSREAFRRLEGRGVFADANDIELEVRQQGVVPPGNVRKVFEPLGSREDWVRDRALNKYNGR